jgi:hypothetical protein
MTAFCKSYRAEGADTEPQMRLYSLIEPSRAGYQVGTCFHGYSLKQHLRKVLLGASSVIVLN